MTPTTRRQSLKLIMLLMVTPTTFAQNTATQTIDISSTGDFVFKNKLWAGDQLTIKVTNLNELDTAGTDKSHFSAKLKSGDTKQNYNILLPEEYFVPQGSYTACPGTEKCVARTFINLSNDARYTVLSLNQESGPPIRQIPMVNLVRSWTLSASGGFVVSKMTSPKFYAKTVDSKQIIARNKDDEDDMSLGMAGFLHTCYDNINLSFAKAFIPRCVNFGLGFSQTGSDLNFMPGIGWRLGDEFHLTVGMQFAKVATLPNGLKVDDPLTSPNDLTNLGSKYVSRPFISISYVFLGGDTKQQFLSTYSPPKTP